MSQDDAARPSTAARSTTDSGSTLAARMAALASELAASLDDDGRRALAGSLDDPEFRRWTYLPGDRPGLSLVDVDATQREVALALLDSAGSVQGAEQCRGVIAVEHARREIVTGAPVPDGDRYWFRVHGDPSGDAPWSWRANGHHLAVHVAVDPSADDTRITLTPHFIGAEPATVPSGPLAGRRLLAPEEDLARELLASLDPDQRRVAVPSDVAPADVLSGMDPVADPSVLPAGLAHGDMSAPSQAALERLVRRYLDRAPAPYADACWSELVDAGLGAVSFTWCGSDRPGEGHYYCVRSSTMIIEYDNTQDDANHAHSVWRHLRDDWGGDVLRAHRSAWHS